MAQPLMFGPEAPFDLLRRASPSSSSSPLTSASPSPSSESPRTATRFVLSLRHVSDSSSPTAADDDIIPKLEDVDGEFEIDENPETITDEAPAQMLSRRPRGRPRKHPKTQITSLAKPPKGRSKTGCITCRRRKKKCDEAKPTCEHCRKNNVHC